MSGGRGFPRPDTGTIGGARAYAARGHGHWRDEERGHASPGRAGRGRRCALGRLRPVPVHGPGHQGRGEHVSCGSTWATGRHGHQPGVTRSRQGRSAGSFPGYSIGTGHGTDRVEGAPTRSTSRLPGMGRMPLSGGGDGRSEMQQKTHITTPPCGIPDMKKAGAPTPA